MILGVRKIFTNCLFSVLAFFSRPQDGFFAVIFTSFLILFKMSQIENFFYNFYPVSTALVSLINFLYLYSLWDGQLSNYLQSLISHGFNLKEIFLRFYMIFFNGSVLFDGSSKLSFGGFVPSVFLYSPRLFGHCCSLSDFSSSRHEIFFIFF